jgi:MFS family permease
MAQPEDTAASKELWLNRVIGADTAWLIGVSAILLLALQPFSSYVASLPFIQVEWAMSNTQAGLVFSSYLLGSAISSLVLVPLTDRISPRRVLILGVTSLALSNLLFPLLAWNAWLGALLRFLAGAGHIAAYIPGIQLVSERYAGRKRGAAVGVFVGAGYAGTTFSYVFMGTLLNYASSWRVAYFITALVGLLGVVLAFGLTRSAGVKPGVEAGRAAERERPVGVKGDWRLNLGVLRDRAAALVITAYALHTAELYLARLWFPLLLGAALVQNGVGSLEATALAATLSGFMFMTGIAGVFIGGAISDTLGRSAGAALIFSVSGLCSFLAGWLLGLPPLILTILGFIYGFTTAADSAIYSTAVTELSPPGQMGSTQAVQSFIGFAIGALMPVAAGSILDLAAVDGAGWGLAFSFNGLLALVGVVALLWLRKLPEAGRMAGGKK